MKLKTGFFLLITVFLLTGCNDQETSIVQENLSLSNNLQKQTMQEEKEVINKAVIKTEKGEIEIVLFPDKAPETVKNFADKAKAG